MPSIITFPELDKLIIMLMRNRSTVVLTGGCFDILHIGHVKFLQTAKQLGNKLIILLENDNRVRRLKGINRPVFKQLERAQVLVSLRYVDYVIMLPDMKTDEEYQKLVFKLKPQVIAVTTHDPLLEIKEHQAKTAGGRVEIIPYMNTLSSSKLAKILDL